jgi:hypothetical protein
LTAQEMSKLVGAHVYLEPLPGFQVQCRVTNAKTSYGVKRLEIEPLAGEGRAWVNLTRVKLCYPGGARVTL